MNALRQPASSSLSSVMGLVSAIAACSGACRGDLVTVGVRPTQGAAAVGGSAEGAMTGLPIPGSNVMNQMPDGNSTMNAAPGTSAGALAVGASGTSAEGGAGASGGPSSATAGAGGAAGASAAPVAMEDKCGTIPTQPAGKVTSGRVTGSGLVGYAVSSANTFTGLRTTLSVPAEPPPSGQIFIWPGIQPTPYGSSFQPIGNGALLPVLTWGQSCAPDAPPGYSSWWIAPTYSNISSSDSQYAGCHVGKAVPTEPMQFLEIDIHLEGTKWIERVVNRDTLEASELSIDLKGQTQGRAFFDIELPTRNKPTEDIVFSNTVLSMEMADPDACQPVMRGMNDFAAKARVSADGRHCCIDRIVLRASGVMATTIDPP